MKKPTRCTIFVPSSLCYQVPNDGKFQYWQRVGTGINFICQPNDEFLEWMDSCGIDHCIDTRWHDGVTIQLTDDNNLVTLKLRWPQVIPM
jgi:hypothetical protein